MAEVVLFHHVLGLTGGFQAVAGERRAAGHVVHTPDPFGGQRPATIDDGVALTEAIGNDVLRERADLALAGLPEGLRICSPTARVPSYDPDAAGLVLHRSRELLDRVR